MGFEKIVVLCFFFGFCWFCVNVKGLGIDECVIMLFSLGLGKFILFGSCCGFFIDVF